MRVMTGAIAALTLAGSSSAQAQVSVLREGVVNSAPETIAEFVRSNAPSVVRIGLEAGPTATWLWTELKQLGLPVISSGR